MSLTSPTRVRQILAELGLQPSKALGQNFLIDRNILDIILAAAELEAGDSVVEIGPGLGVLTVELLARVKRVYAIEKDAALCEYLVRELGANPHLAVEHADAVKARFSDLPARGFNKVVSNLPYREAGRILMSLSMGRPVDAVVVTVQREVAERVTAGAGTTAYGLLSLWTQLAYDTAIVKDVSPNCFRPRPAVWSSVLRLVRRPSHLPADDLHRDRLYRLSRYAFMHRRKQLAPLLAKAVREPRCPTEHWHSVLDSMGLPRGARPEDLSSRAWCDLVTGPLADSQLSVDASPA